MYKKLTYGDYKYQIFHIRRIYIMKKYFLLTMCMALTMILFCGCGNSKTPASTDTSSETSTQTSSEAENNNNNSSSSSESDSDKGIIGETGDAVKDVADGVADGVKDVADGVGNTVSGIFNSFDDAQDWFMNQLPSEDGRFEVVNSDKDLTQYSDGKTGYHIELHDNTREGDTKVGDFYIDANDGKVYRSDEFGKTFAEYDFSEFK